MCFRAFKTECICLMCQVMFVMGGWSGGAPTNMVETYDTRADRWIVCPVADIGKTQKITFVVAIVYCCFVGYPYEY